MPDSIPQAMPHGGPPCDPCQDKYGKMLGELRESVIGTEASEFPKLERYKLPDLMFLGIQTVVG